MAEAFPEKCDIEALAGRVGTPFFVYSSEVLRRRIRDLKGAAEEAGVRVRYAMKACSSRRVLEVVREEGLWIDAVSGNEILRAQSAGFPMGSNPPVVLYTSDVLRDNALAVIREHDVLPNIGSPAMIDALREAEYRGPIGIRINPGFGHGHVSACDTGGPSSKHGVWHGDTAAIRESAVRAGTPIVMLHAHVGSGPAIEEFTANVAKLARFFTDRIADYPRVEAVNFGGGLPHAYRPEAPKVDLAPLMETLANARRALSERAGRAIRVEIEPGRSIVAPSALLVTRVADVKRTGSNEKGRGHTFVMVDAGFTDLLRPAMYGSYHHITVAGHDARDETTPVVIAGPLCESGDVFTRSGEEMLEPRPLPLPRRNDLILLHDVGAYGVAMSSTYNSIGRAPQVWLEDGRAFLISRRETVEDLTRAECFVPLW